MSDLVIPTTPDDPKADVLIKDLIREYDSRYGRLFSKDGARAELYRYPPEAFAPERGGYFFLIERAGETIAGGAFMRYDESTAELKRVWTRSDLRRQGLARRVVDELEKAAVLQGYTRVFLTTGFRQPEASGLYRNLGYRPLFDPAVPAELYATLPFEKHIGREEGRAGSAPLRQPAASLAEAALAAAAYKADASRNHTLAGVR